MFFLMRCMSESEIKDFIEKGAVQFSYPNLWVNLEEGRGDYREGTYAYIQFDDFKNIPRLANKFSDTEGFTKNRIVYFRRKSVMSLPTYCFYSFKREQLPTPQSLGLHEVESSIDASYFKDFQTSNINDPTKAIILHKPEEFFCILKESLYKIGVKPEEILIGEVKYRSSTLGGNVTGFEIPEPSPYEIFAKDKKRFNIQEELRIVINTTNIDIISRLIKYPNPVLLGNLSSYVSKIDDYPLDGLILKGQGIAERK